MQADAAMIEGKRKPSTRRTAYSSTGSSITGREKITLFRVEGNRYDGGTVYSDREACASGVLPGLAVRMGDLLEA